MKINQHLEVLQEDEQDQVPDNQLTEALSEGFLPILALLEGQVAPGVWDCTVIESGWSKNGRYYSPEVVREMLPLLEGATVARYKNGQHLPPQYRSEDYGTVDNAVGVTAKPWAEDMDNGHVRAKALFHCSDESLNRKMQVAQEAIGGTMVPNYGLSIDARGPQRPGSIEGRTGLIVEKVNKVLETTVVNKPAANGKVNFRIAAGLDDEEDDPMLKRLLAFLMLRAAQKSQNVGGLQTLQEADVVARTASELQEMLGANAILSMALGLLASNKTQEAGELLQGLLETMPKPAAIPALAAPAQPAAEPAVAVASPAVAEPAAAAPAQESLAEVKLELALMKSGLAPNLQESVMKQFKARIARGEVPSKEELQEAIDDRRALVASPARGNGLVQSQNVEVSSRGTVQPQEALQYRMDLMCGYRPNQALLEADPAAFYAYNELMKHPAMQRIKRIYQDMCDDRNCEFTIGQNSVLHEALSTDFPTCLAIAINKSVNMFWDMEGDPWWKPFVYIDETVDDYFTRSNISRGGFGNLGNVVESTTTDTFPELGNPMEMSTSYSIASKGGKFILTKHIVKGDKSGVFNNLAEDFVRACVHVLNRFVGGLLVGRTAAGINQANTWDNTVIYSTAHGNRTTSALSQTAIAAGLDLLRNMRRPGLKTTITTAISDVDEETIEFATTKGMFEDTVLAIDSELVRVKSVTDSANCECERGYLGTTKATHSDNAVVYERIDQMPGATVGLIVPTNKRNAMYTALSTPGAVGGNNNDMSVVNEEYKNGKIVPVVVDPHYLGGNIYNWFMMVYAKFRKHTTLAFMDNKQKPEVLLQDQPTVGKVFDRNNYTYRTEFEFGGTNNDYLGLQGNFASS